MSMGMINTGQLTRLTDPQQNTTTWNYNPDGTLYQKILPHGIYTQYKYDGAKRLTDQWNYGPGGVLLDYYNNFQYYANGQIYQYQTTVISQDNTTIWQPERIVVFYL